MVNETKPPDQTQALQDFEKTVDRIVQLDDERKNPDERLLYTKMNSLDRAIQAWRFYSGVDSNSLKFEDFISSEISASGQTVGARIVDNRAYYGTGKKATQYQTKLLLFLLLHHSSKRDIVDTITEFVEVIRGDLSIIDFKILKTGSYRCVTNIRFCSNTLREGGLLKVSKKEKYKAWVLSLPGLIVAAQILSGSRSWKLSDSGETGNHGLHTQIQGYGKIDLSPDDAMDELASLLPPSSNVLREYHGTLLTALGKLRPYWSNFLSPLLKKGQFKNIAASILEDIDSDRDMQAFYRDFMESLDYDDLRERVEKFPDKSDVGGVLEDVLSVSTDAEVSLVPHGDEGNTAASLIIQGGLPGVQFSRSQDSHFHVALVGELELRNNNDELIGRNQILVSAKLAKPGSRHEEPVVWPAKLDPNIHHVSGSVAMAIASSNIDRDVVTSCHAASATDVDPLLAALKVRAKDYAVGAMTELQDQGEAEAWAMKEILEEQQRLIGKEDKNWVSAWRKGRQKRQSPALDGDNGNPRKRARTQFWIKRAKEIADDLKTEPQRIRDGYVVTSQTLRITRFVYLCPREVIN